MTRADDHRRISALAGLDEAGGIIPPSTEGGIDRCSAPIWRTTDFAADLKALDDQIISKGEEREVIDTEMAVLTRQRHDLLCKAWRLEPGLVVEVRVKQEWIEGIVRAVRTPDGLPDPERYPHRNPWVTYSPRKLDGSFSERHIKAFGYWRFKTEDSTAKPENGADRDTASQLHNGVKP